MADRCYLRGPRLEGWASADAVDIVAEMAQ